MSRADWPALLLCWAFGVQLGTLGFGLGMFIRGRWPTQAQATCILVACMFSSAFGTLRLYFRERNRED
jgi:hypothetical protein